MADVCHECGEEYRQIANHWAAADCSYPRLSDYQLDVCTGLIMGDGSLRKHTASPGINVIMTAKEYLEHLSSNAFPICSGNVNLRFTAQKAAGRVRQKGFYPEAKEKDYSDIYQFSIMSHPDLEQYRQWYKAGEKTFPKTIDLTPTVLKHWYVGDGYFDREHGMVQISLYNERGNKEKICQMFHRAGLTDFSWYANDNIGEVKFGIEGTKNFFDFIGCEPLPGFEYKFPD